MLRCLRKSQLGFGFGLLILLKTETRWIFRNLVFCKTELPPMTRENTEFGLVQFVLQDNNCLLSSQSCQLRIYYFIEDE